MLADREQVLYDEPEEGGRKKIGHRLGDAVYDYMPLMRRPAMGK
jgi:hypothetical protein